MHRTDFSRDSFVSSFRTSDPSTSTDRVGHAVIPDEAPLVPPNPSKRRPFKLSPRKKGVFRWNQLVSFLPLLWIIGHGIWEGHHLKPDAALVQAAQSGNLAAVRSALAHGANVDSTCPCGRSALAWAACDGNTAVASYLISRGATINHVDDDGDSALTLAAWNRHDAIATLLIARGANANQVNGKGGSALWSAIQHQDTGLAASLLAHGANANQMGQQGWTMLMDAARDNSLPLVKILLAHGASVNLRSQVGWTACGVAVTHHYAAVLAALRKAGGLTRAESAAMVRA